MSSRTKLALFLYEEPSLWTSCEKINANLVSLYKDFSEFKGHELRAFYLDGSHYGNHKIVKSVLDYDPDEYVFIDHRLYPDKVLLPLQEFGLDLKSKKYTIHVFGHYALRMKRYEMIFNLLQGCKVNYRFPSQRFLNSFAKIFPKDFRSALSVCPIPVAKKYAFKRQTTSQGVKSILYAGRISPRKNCHILLEAVKLLRSQRQDFRLLLAGNFDNYLPYKTNLAGSYMGEITRALAEMDPQGLFITFLGFLKEDALIRTLHQSDIYCSLSTMVADDYGLGLAEAMVSGLPVVATDWGGYSQIMGMGEGAMPIKVGYQDKKHDLSVERVALVLSQALDHTLSGQERSKMSKKNNETFSNPQIIGYLESSKHELQAKPTKLTKIMELAAQTPFVEDRLYETIYREIWEEKK